MAEQVNRFRYNSCQNCGKHNIIFHPNMRSWDDCEENNSTCMAITCEDCQYTVYPRITYEDVYDNAEEKRI